MERMADELTCVCRTRLASGFQLDAGLSLPLHRAPITVLFGPSGAGKTTLLRMLAGLHRPAEGSIVFRGRPWFDSSRAIDLPPQQRRAGFLAQDYALFPHLTVAANIAYAAPPGEGSKYLDAFGLTEFAGRVPRAISSGQRQRVALARALSANPVLLLLDEPLSALDAATRGRTRQQLRQMLLSSGIPAIVVTHDRVEAVALGDWIVVMLDGRVRQSGPIRDVLQHPADAQVAESVGVENVLPAHIVGRESGLLTLETGGVTLQSVDGGEEGPVVACIRAEDVALTRDLTSPSSARNRLTGRVTSVVMEAPLSRIGLDCGFPMVAVITAQSASDLQLKADDVVCAIVKTTSVHVAAHDEGAI
jgi:molybdate transport system ATP-binding protein